MSGGCVNYNIAKMRGAMGPQALPMVAAPIIYGVQGLLSHVGSQGNVRVCVGIRSNSQIFQRANIGIAKKIELVF